MYDMLFKYMWYVI